MRQANLYRWATALCLAATLTTAAQTASGQEPDESPVIRALSDLDVTLVEVAYDLEAELQPPASVPSTQAVDDTPQNPQPRARRSRSSRGRSSSGRRSYDLLASVPNMFGDFYGSGGGLVQTNQQPMNIFQMFTDGNPFDLFVQNPLGPGANADPAVPIRILRGGPTGVFLAQSVGPGFDTNGDNEPDTYPISEPVGSSPGPGAAYLGGQASFPGGNALGQGDDWVLQFGHRIQPTQLLVALPPGGGAVRRVKIAENNSPQPRCRFFYNYNFFNDVIGGFGDVNRHTFGYERTFCMFGVDSSLDLRIPFAGTLASEQVSGGGQLRDTQFGNISLVLKSVMWQNDTDLISAGVGLAVPTGQDSSVFLPNGAKILEWDSESVHLLPFIAAMSFRERLFWQAFLQFDFDANGSQVSGNTTGGALNSIGVLQDAALMFVDVGGGYTLYDNPCAAGPQSISAIAELHYSTTLQNTDFAVGQGFFVGNLTPRYDVLNLSVGANIQWNNISVRPAIAVPLRDGHDEQFDFEAMVQVNIGL